MRLEVSEDLVLAHQMIFGAVPLFRDAATALVGGPQVARRHGRAVVLDGWKDHEQSFELQRAWHLVRREKLLVDLLSWTQSGLYDVEGRFAESDCHRRGEVGHAERLHLRYEDFAS